MATIRALRRFLWSGCNQMGDAGRAGARPQPFYGPTMTYRHALAAKLVGLALVAAVLSLAPASARNASFDGNWSVLIITESGTCDAAYRYGVIVDNGAVHYRGESGIDVAGSVDDKGRVRVRIGRGEQSAEGIGQLSETSGSGTWSGSSSSSLCQGRWEAERR
jgi:hypothetical protein